MKGNKYDNLYGEDRDWIEDALRDYDVPDGVINEIGAHFFVLQTKVDKLIAEKESRRDIFVEIARDAERDELIKTFLTRDEKTSIRAERLQKKDPPTPPTVDEIISLWPAGMRVTYNTCALRGGIKTKVAAEVYHDGRIATFKYKNRDDLTNLGQGNYGVQDWLHMLKPDQLSSLRKKLIKNNQRAADKKNYVKSFADRYPTGSLKSKAYVPITSSYVVSCWPIGQHIAITNKTNGDTLFYTRVNSRDITISDAVGVVLKRMPIITYTSRLCYYDLRRVLKLLFKNNQRKLEQMRLESRLKKS